MFVAVEGGSSEEGDTAAAAAQGRPAVEERVGADPDKVEE